MELSKNSGFLMILGLFRLLVKLKNLKNRGIMTFSENLLISEWIKFLIHDGRGSLTRAIGKNMIFSYFRTFVTSYITMIVSWKANQYGIYRWKLRYFLSII